MDRVILKYAGFALAIFLVLAPSASGESESVIRFGLIADVHAHDIDSPFEGKWMTNTEARLTAFVDAMNTWAPDFVVELGDFVNGWVILGADPGDPARIPGLLAWADGLFARFEGPRYHVIGNHDVYNLDKATYREILGLPETSYSFDVRGFHFVVLDLQFSPDGSALEHTYMGVEGFLPEEGLTWLRQDLAATEAPTIVFVHQMLDTFIEELGRPLIHNQPEIQALLETDGDVIAVFQGHAHDNVYQEIHGIHYVTFEALVDQGTPPSWARITLDQAARTLRIDGMGDQASYDLAY